MRKVLILTAIVILMLTGCSKVGINHEDKESQTKPTDTPKYTAQLLELSTPNYFIPQSLTPNGLLFGQAGDNLIGYDPESKQTVTFIEGAWSGYLAPDGKKISYTNEKGLILKDLESQKIIELKTPENEMASSLTFGTWSSDSNKFIYMLPFEWSSNYFIYDLVQNKSNPYQFNNVNNFLSLPVSWNNKQIAFIVSANKSKAGEQEYREAGYRSNLFLADESGNFTQLTDVEDDSFIEFCGITKDNKKALVILSNKSENKKRAGLIIPPSSKISFLPKEDNIVAASISPDGQFAVILSEPENGQFNVKLYDLDTINQFFNQAIKGNEPPPYFIWTPGKQLYFGLRNNTANYDLYSITIS